jgi:hypothetical protein
MLRTTGLKGIINISHELSLLSPQNKGDLRFLYDSSLGEGKDTVSGCVVPNLMDVRNYLHDGRVSHPSSLDSSEEVYTHFIKRFFFPQQTKFRTKFVLTS